MDVDTTGIEYAIRGLDTSLDFDFSDYALLALCFAAFTLGWRKTVSGLALFCFIDVLSDGNISTSEKYLPVLAIGLIVLLVSWIKNKFVKAKRRQPAAPSEVENLPEERLERQSSAERMLAKIGK